MALRHDEHGKPVGLDWDTISAGCPQDPSVWKTLPARRQGTRLEAETEAEIVRMHLEGMTNADIAEAVGVSAKTVSVVLDRCDITENRGRGSGQRTPQDVVREIIRLYTEHDMAGAEIGRRVGVRHATVYKILRRNGVAVRSRGRVA